MFVTVAYDVVDDRKRARLSKALSEYGRRVQKSVFECEVDEGQYLRMRERVEKEIDPEEDSVRYYPLCARCLGNIQVYGLGVVREEEEVVIV
jgi:CRISPR-associated protein Cas2